MRNDRLAPIFGIGLIAFGVLANKWTLELLLSPDGRITSPAVIWAVSLFDLALVCLGTYLVLRRPPFPYGEAALVVSSIVLSLFLLEAAVRIWVDHVATAEQARLYKMVGEVDPKRRQWSPHHYLNYYPTPEYRKGGTSHNSLGFRGREVSLEKPEGTFRIVALGGSTTYTIEVPDNEQTFTRQLEKKLRDTRGYESLEVINAGAGGYNSWESLINLQFRVLDLRPDLIMIYHGTNDVHARLVEPESYRGDNSGRRMQWRVPSVAPLAEYSYLLRMVSSKLGWDLFKLEGLGSFVNASTYRGAASRHPADEATAFLEKNPPVFFKRNLTSMVAVARAHGVDVLLATWAHSPHFDDYASKAHYQRGFAENNWVVKTVARERGVRLFDFAEVMPKDKRYWADGRHVNEEGARLKAQFFADFLHGSGLLTAQKTAAGN